MNKYLVLLRGINVGGKNIIKMADLKTGFEAMGFSKVITYIQSGNVLFQSDEQDLMPANGSGITLADMKFQRAKPIHILSKPIMPNSDITLLASLVNHVVVLDVLMHLNVDYAYLFMHLIAGNFINNASQIMPHMSCNLLAHDI